MDIDMRDVGRGCHCEDIADQPTVNVDSSPVAVPEGMTLRDWFAGQALAGMMAYPGDARYGSWNNNAPVEEAAAQAYRHADAMLAERAKEDN